MGVFELAGEQAQLIERALVIVERPRPAQPLLHARPVALGQPSRFASASAFALDLG